MAINGSKRQVHSVRRTLKHEMRQHLIHRYPDKDKGPQVGNLLFYLGRELVLDRLNQVKINEKEIWEGCSVNLEEIITYIQENSEKISSSSYKLNAGDK